MQVTNRTSACTNGLIVLSFPQRTPLDLARTGGYVKIVAYLRGCYWNMVVSTVLQGKRAKLLKYLIFILHPPVILVA